MKAFKANVIVKRKPGVLDPEGKTIAGSLKKLGYDSIDDLGVGKVFDIKFHAENMDDAKAKITEISKTVLSNPIIENFEIIEIVE